MIDFMMVSTRMTKRGNLEIYPKFIIKKCSDLMIRGGDFYAIWIDELGLWSTDEQDALQMIDRELDNYKLEHSHELGLNAVVLHMWDSENGMIDHWHRYCQKHMRDNYHTLDEQLIFANTITHKKDYASKKLSYSLEEGSITAYDQLISTLYSPEERQKIEWAIGSIVSGDSKKIQKFLVLYGSAGTGKSTILNIIQDLFEGYYSVFDARALGSTSNSFALESFKSNPLVGIQHDGDLSRIEDNTRLNSLVSHETMTVNEKFKSQYATKFNCFLLMGTNKPVKITDAKSGLIRRLIDVTPTGNKLDRKTYDSLVKQSKFELGAIASHCLNVYLKNKSFYNDYVPTSMLSASNDFYNFVSDSYFEFKESNGVTLKNAWTMYKKYCDDAKVPYPYAQRLFKEELKNYFDDYKERYTLDDGTRVRSYYLGFRIDKFEGIDDINKKETNDDERETYTIELETQDSIFDKLCCDCPAQYATSKETPTKKWEEVTSKLSELDTSKVHYVRVPENHIVIDFDIPDENGKKSLEKNIEAASKWPPTYTELSKSGCGVHLHYIYKGDPSKLSRVYDEHIEIKVFSGKSSLRRRLSKCNKLDVAIISSNLPLKGDGKLVNVDTIKTEKGIRKMIIRNLNKEIHPGTKPSIDFIFKILEDAYNNKIVYDVTSMRPAILAFAANSTNQADYCIQLVNKMKFKSEEDDVGVNNDEKPIVFYDVEVFPNLFLVNWKFQGKENNVVRMINPNPEDIEALTKYRLVGFNCRRYDNHIMYARIMGYTNEQLYNLSQRIINGSPNCMFASAYNLSYTDVYDFASAANKKSLKKFEIELGIKHHELGLPWDKPVPEDLWPMVAEYCDDDVLATEEVFNHLSADWMARQILADLAGMTVNDTTNTLTTRIIFGKNRNPQTEFNYRDLSKPVYELDKEMSDFLKKACPEMMAEPHGPKKSLLPYFEGYRFERGKSTYREFNEDNPNPKRRSIGEGGLALANEGMYIDVALLDITSMHPHSAIAEVLFGLRYTKAFKEIVDSRVSIKHKAWDEVNNMLNGLLTPYIQKVIDGEITAGDLANALKTAINSVYGLTSAKFENAFRDNRNIDNIVAKRGALFMVDLKHAVENKGFKVAHIKTDSIKIPEATPEIIQFVMAFGKRYGYNFEHEATYEKMCIVNDAVYIAKYMSSDDCKAKYGYIPGDNEKKGGKWTATGTQFQVPYVFKTLFSKEPIEFLDLCETKSVTSSLYLDKNENLPDVSKLERSLELAIKNAKKFGIDLDISGNSGDSELDELVADIQKGHNYKFVGKVGEFCPIKSGCNGGVLLREKDGKYYAATGSKGYRWLEASTVKELQKENCIDRSYYDAMVDEAVEAISKYCDFEWFCA